MERRPLKTGTVAVPQEGEVLLKRKGMGARYGSGFGGAEAIQPGRELRGVV